ncbi:MULTISPECIES: glycosyltransferase family 2 protein [unclassified Arcicella]|uniref:glycosyltransferase family 2 protein n=1 Tax=unclassified Arcicella TaxID=2644986 RepID=UPI0028589A49|nr:MULTISPECIES: glycosyltransferase family 2 protein [unclassified Arcicella]MDR6563883.1 rhamnosyltransferase [Arcicella sp. BE51]MDR6813636.1 rhamnosyltransferase [Arcicella sp. BE140]MDR6824983.1 rhamnosyltransferase [Arcicella sp. BE139]
MKTAAVVILYHPTQQTLQNINSYHTAVDKLFVLDNTEGSASIINQSSFNNPTIHYSCDGINKGIAERLNEAAQQAINEGFEWLLLMDQDSSFEGNTFDLYIDSITNYQDKKQVALFGPNFSRQYKESIAETNLVKVPAMITSGSFLNLAAYQQIGPFDEALFIDGVDTEYCLRAQNCGYDIIMFLNIFLKHELGEAVKRASIKTLYMVKKVKDIHSPIRCYYIYRNNLYLQTKYKHLDKMVMKDINGGAITNIKKSIFYGTESRQIFKYLIKAHRDFKQNKMGKYQP